MTANDKGSALISVMVVLFILLTAFFAVFSFALSRAGLLNKEINITRARYLADAGINRLLQIADTESLGWTEIISLRLNEKISPTEEFKVESSLTGGYIRVTSTGIAGSQRIAQSVLIGIMPWSDMNSAIINCSNTFPLVVAGATRINGDAIVGPQAITDGTIEGEPYQGDKLINGEIIIREKVICPEIDNDAVRQYVNQMMDEKTSATNYIVGSAILRDFNEYKKNKKVVICVEDNLDIQSLRLNSYTSGIKIIAGGNIAIRENCEIRGLVEIMAGGSIYLGGASFLEGTTLTASDSIVFSNSVKFSGQALAGRRISINGGAEIGYPALLYVYCTDDDEDNTIVFNAGGHSRAVAVIAGHIDTYSKKMHRLFIDSGAVSAGLMFCDQYTDIEGALHGISLTKEYYYRKDPTTYINWIKNAEIDRHRLDFLPVMPVSFAGRNKYAVFRILSVG